jgi:hypothetical protein
MCVWALKGGAKTSTKKNAHKKRAVMRGERRDKNVLLFILKTLIAENLHMKNFV